MTRGTQVTHLIRAGLVAAVALVALLGPATSVAWGQESVDEGTASETSWDGEALDPADDIERWWGAAGAILCAAEVRLVRVAPAVGMNPYVLAAGVGGCLLAAMDVLTTQ